LKIQTNSKDFCLEGPLNPRPLSVLFAYRILSAYCYQVSFTLTSNSKVSPATCDAVLSVTHTRDLLLSEWLNNKKIVKHDGLCRLVLSRVGEA